MNNRSARVRRFLFVLVIVLTPGPAVAQDTQLDTSRGDQMIAAYFEAETNRLADRCLAGIDTLQQWEAVREEYRQQLLEMLGLDPVPPRTELHATVTGVTEHDDFNVERLHFQSRPGLYVTGNLYLPQEVDQPLPAVLYVCGHGAVRKDGVSFGNKVHYHHHGSWLARNGYVCLTIDSLQLGEIEGIHHGTHRYDMWWWLCRGYTPAGVEAWNCIRALDYLQSRSEVDSERLGVTGRSGGGAYSWWIAAIDQRIKAAVPVAGITDLENHVVDGCVEGHCDCMFMVNTYGWDYPLVAALVAPRPLLLSNTDNDRIFPLDGVVRTHAKVRHIYALYNAQDKLGLNITAGPHKDTQELRVHAFRWLDQHLKQEDRLVKEPAVKYFEPEQLRVLEQIPEDQQNTEIHESFVPLAEHVPVPDSQEQWQMLRDNWLGQLREKAFRGWPDATSDTQVKEVWRAEAEGLVLRAVDFSSQPTIQLRLYILERADLDQPELAVLNVVDQQQWTEFLAAARVAFASQLEDESLPPPDESAFADTCQMLRTFPWSMVYLAPRGVGPTTWDLDEKKQTQIRRRFYLLGQTLDGMRVWDVRRAVQAVRSLPTLEDTPLWLQAQDQLAGVALYASLFEPDIARLDLYRLPASHREGPILLNVQRYLDLPQAAAMAGQRSKLVLYGADPQQWEFVTATAAKLQWKEGQVQFRELPPADEPEPAPESSDAEQAES